MSQVLSPLAVIFMKHMFIYLFISLSLFGQIDKVSQIRQLLLQDDCKEGSKIIKGLVDKKKATNYVYFYKATCEYRDHEFEQAVQSCSKGLKITRESDSLYIYLLRLRGYAFRDMGKLASAISDNEKLVKMQSNNVDFLLNLSYLYGENNRLHDCVGILMRALSLDSANVYLLNNLAYYNCLTQDYKAVIKYADKGLALTKDSAWIAPLLNSLGFAQARTISANKGIQTITQSIKYKPDNPYAYFNIGLIYIDTDQNDEACKYFRKAKQLGGVNLTANYLKKYCE